MKHLLMENNIESDDFNKIIKFLKKKPRLTASNKVREFERNWCKWLGTKYSIFVNSGSSANLISIATLKILNKNNYKNEIIVPSLTWSSDVASIIHCGFKPIFADIELDTLSMSLENIKRKISKKTLAIFYTHAQGFNGFDKELLDFIRKKKIILIEDACESHGATFKDKKIGSLGLISNFSFYYAHHMSTIEGGMICTNNKEVYNIASSMRAHGLARECNNKKLEKKIQNKYKNLSKDFIFLYPSYNMRNNEIGGILGINQLKKLDRNIKLRNRNFNYFLKLIDKDKFYSNFKTQGSSNYAFPLILKSKNLKKRNRLESLMIKNNIEFRRGNAGGGNQIRQPYVKKFVKNLKLKNFPNVEHVHFYGYYIGNYPQLNLKKIEKICKILNEL